MRSFEALTPLLYGPMWTFLCVLSRLGPMLTLMPPIQGATIPMRVKVLLVLMVALVMTPIVLEFSTPLPSNLPDLAIGLIKELCLGLLFGSAVLIISTSLQVGGQVISSLASMDIAQTADPTTEESVTVISQMFSWMAMALFLTLGGHRYVIGACLDSFETYPAGGVLAERYWLLHLHELLGHSVSVGLRAAAPAAIALLLANFVTALIGRTLPQLNILAVGFNINILMMLVVLVCTIASIGWVFQDELADWVRMTTNLFPSPRRTV